MIDPNISLEQINRFVPNTLMEHLGIEYTSVGEDFLCARMPVDHRHHQPFGILHGGASVALAESVGSAASSLMLNPDTHVSVGLEINANHVRPVREGHVEAKAQLVHGGKRSHIWDIRITNSEDQIVCICRLTMAIIEKTKS